MAETAGESGVVAAPNAAASAPSLSTALSAASGVRAEVHPGRSMPLAVIELRGGALARVGTLDAAGTAQATFPMWGPIGPSVMLVGSGTASPFMLAEGFFGAGLAGHWLLTDRLAATAGLHAIGLMHAWSYEDGTFADSGAAFDAGAAIPASLSYALTDSIALTLGVTGGATARERIHRITGVTEWERSRIFAEISTGLTFRLRDRAAGVEKSGSIARGEGDG